MQEYLNKQFWFDFPSSHSAYFIPMIVLFTLSILGAIAIKLLLNKEQKKFFSKYFLPLMSIGVLGLIHVFARYESLPWLSTRFFAGLLLFVFLTWILAVSIWYIRYFPKYQIEKKTEERYKKYLPKNAKIKI